ncbi:hypothetical protein H9Q72_009209 [Fusarium xylarioides]|uniref:Uncharacterized protein n=1 Tax=Fusarium xylarioides TaxID=221167 RepID=A0A9P7HVK7_9HYPO|nr:hypothetical protein H9Q72_009209 [Fusarium xylarioides]
MDPFNSLPPEVRLQVLISLPSKFSLSSIIRASPTMLQQYLERRTHIRQSLIANDLDEEMMQDALAIIQFLPTRGVPSINIRVVRRHLQRWLDKDFVSPLTNADDSLMQSLDKLHSMLLYFIQDYCSKALSSYMPREYLCLQGVQSPSPTAELVFRLIPITASFNPDNLTKMELERFLKAFLLYELNCKVAKILGTSPNPANPSNNLPRRSIKPSENEAIHCVHTYVRSLYGACIAQREDGFLPSGPDGSEFEAPLVFPDNFCFDPDIYTGDRGLRGNYHGDATSHLAKLGLETIAGFTGYGFRLSGENKLFDEQFGALLNSPLYRMGPYQHAITRVDPSDDAGSLMYHNLFARLSRSNTTQLQIYQQRAWVFFDNDRLYLPRISARPRFPSENLLFQEADRPVDLIAEVTGNTELLRSRIRSQKWQDEYAIKKQVLALDNENYELQEENFYLRGEIETLRQTISENSESSLTLFEDQGGSQ